METEVGLGLVPNIQYSDSQCKPRGGDFGGTSGYGIDSEAGVLPS